MKQITKIYLFIVAVGLILLVNACANMSQGPTGGPEDITPPKVVKSFPANGSLYFKKKQIQIDFDEIVTVEKASDNVIISPPQQNPPDVKSYGKQVTVTFNQDLTDSTTYSIDFGNAIVDNNEKNPLRNYVFAFSTGGQIDTMRVSGTVVNAQDLNPMPGIYVGIYATDNDSSFFKNPFIRIGKTDEYGRFSISNMKNGKFKVYALDDVNHDFFYQPGEGLAMHDSLVVPTSRMEEMRDTIWKDSITVDSVHKYMGTRFLPDDLALRFFKENKKRQYFVKFERKEPFVFNLFFNAPAAELPKLTPLNFKWDDKYLLQKNATKDSLTYWLTDSTVWNVDTLQMSMTYLKTDSLFKLVPVTDTINVAMRKARLNPRAKIPKKVVITKVEPYKFSNNVSGAFEIYNPIILRFEAPMDSFDISKIKLNEKVDTVFKTIPFKWKQLDSTKMCYSIAHEWTAETAYKIEIDSAAFKSIYKRISNKYDADFKIRSLDEYSSLKIQLTAFNPKVVMQVLDPKDMVLATKPASEKGTVFEYLRPGDYYLRMFIDTNGNGVWDTGDLSTKRHPEEVYYYPRKFTLKANWEFEETWDYNAVTLLKQKPVELLKDDPNKEKKAARTVSPTGNKPATNNSLNRNSSPNRRLN